MSDRAYGPVEWQEFGAASIDGVGVLDGDEYVYTNRPFADVYGYDEPDELVGTTWQDRYEPGERKRIESEVLPQVHEEGHWRGESVGRRRNGETVPLELSLRATENELVVCVVRSVREASTLRRSDDELREEHRFLREVVDALDDILYVYDENGDLCLWNEALTETTGYTRAEIEAIDPKQLVPKEQHEYVPGLAEPVESLDDRRIELDLLTNSGERIPHEFRGSTFENPETGRRFRCGIAWDIRDRLERERELRTARRFNEELVENAPFGMFRLDEDLRITYENPRAEEIIGLPDNEESSSAIGAKIHELPPIVETGQAALFTRLNDGETIEFEFPFESIYGKEAYFVGRGVPLYRDGEFDGAILMAIDISDRRRQERNLERQRNELDTLNRINDLLLELTRELLESPTREELERTVCKRLAASTLYQFAWIGELGADNRRLVPRTSAGVDDGYVEAVTITADETGTGQGPGGRALRTKDVQVSQNIRTDPAFEPWREAALDRGIQSAAAVPLFHGGTTYGCLAVYSTRPFGFSQREQAAFEVLGEAVGFAIHAIETRRLLFADAVLELEFQFAGPDQFLLRHSERFECDLSVEGYVATKSGGWSLYVGVENASPAALCEAAADIDTLERVRVVRAAPDEGLLEYRFGESPLLETLAEAGVKLRSAAATAGIGRFVVEAPRSADVREVVDRVRDVYPTAELLAQHERDRSVAEVAVPGGPFGDLTERQREALEAAYRAGYFDWPRESTAEEVADSLEVSSPTLHRHLRRAEKRLLAALFDADS
jgi:PAS domain S-box-containing protein